MLYADAMEQKKNSKLDFTKLIAAFTKFAVKKYVAPTGRDLLQEGATTNSPDMIKASYPETLYEQADFGPHELTHALYSAYQERNFEAFSAILHETSIRSSGSTSTQYDFLAGPRLKEMRQGHDDDDRFAIVMQEYDDEMERVRMMDIGDRRREMEAAVPPVPKGYGDKPSGPSTSGRP